MCGLRSRPSVQARPALKAPPLLCYVSLPLRALVGRSSNGRTADSGLVSGRVPTPAGSPLKLFHRSRSRAATSGCCTSSLFIEAALGKALTSCGATMCAGNGAGIRPPNAAPTRGPATASGDEQNAQMRPPVSRIHPPIAPTAPRSLLDDILSTTSSVPTARRAILPPTGTPGAWSEGAERAGGWRPARDCRTFLREPAGPWRLAARTDGLRLADSNRV